MHATGAEWEARWRIFACVRGTIVRAGSENAAAIGRGGNDDGQQPWQKPKTGASYATLARRHSCYSRQARSRAGAAAGRGAGVPNQWRTAEIREVRRRGNINALDAEVCDLGTANALRAPVVASFSIYLFFFCWYCKDNCTIFIRTHVTRCGRIDRPKILFLLLMYFFKCSSVSLSESYPLGNIIWWNIKNTEIDKTEMLNATLFIMKKNSKPVSWIAVLVIFNCRPLRFCRTFCIRKSYFVKDTK